jgi:type I restriction enzyme M protein
VNRHTGPPPAADRPPVPEPTFAERERTLAHPGRAGGEHSWTVERKEIEARGYDLKAVNPNAKRDEDTRTPEELLDVIEAKGREVADAIAELRKLL